MERKIVAQIFGKEVSYTQGDPHIRIGSDVYKNFEKIETELKKLQEFVKEAKKLMDER